LAANGSLSLKHQAANYLGNGHKLFMQIGMQAEAVKE